MNASIRLQNGIYCKTNRLINAGQTREYNITVISEIHLLHKTLTITVLHRYVVLKNNSETECKTQT